MTRRIILCEGPDDVAALRTLGLYFFGAQREATSVSSGAGGEDKKAVLRAGTCKVEITSTNGGKSALPRQCAVTLLNVPPPRGPADESRIETVAVVFDPDEHPASRFYDELLAAARSGAPAWTLTPVLNASGSWTARRDDGEDLSLCAIPWRAPGAVVDGLPDNQNIERLLCAVAGRAYPTEAAIVERWLTEIQSTRGKTPKWKAALHLWCALVDESASETNATARFLHDNKKLRPHVQRALEEVSLWKDLHTLLGPPAAAPPT